MRRGQEKGRTQWWFQSLLSKGRGGDRGGQGAVRSWPRVGESICAACSHLHVAVLPSLAVFKQTSF